MIAGVDYAYQKYNKKIILMGSSYSANLSFKVALENEKVKALLDFSVYYDYCKQFDLALFTKPAFLTATKSEITSIGVDKIYNAISSVNKVLFVPSQEGSHGSSAFGSPIRDEYWNALKAFLNSLTQ